MYYIVVDLVHYTVNCFLGQLIKMHLLLFKSCAFFLYMNILLFKSTVPLLMDMWVGSSPVHESLYICGRLFWRGMLRSERFGSEGMNVCIRIN